MRLSGARNTELAAPITGDAWKEWRENGVTVRSFIHSFVHSFIGLQTKKIEKAKSYQRAAVKAKARQKEEEFQRRENRAKRVR